MSFRQRVLLGLIVAGLLAAWTLPVPAQQSGRERAFVEGLQEFGLLTLLQKYLEDLEKEGGDPIAIMEQQARLFEMQGSRANEESRRDEAFGEAKKKYRQLIEEFTAKMEDATEPREKDNLRLRVLELKVQLGEMIWKKQANNQLTNLELTDRQAGDREKVERLLREARDLFESVHEEIAGWQEKMEASPNIEKRYINTGIYDRTWPLKEYARYQSAWTTYYLAYVLPKDKKEERTNLLAEAVEKFSEFTKDEAKASLPRLKSLWGLGMCYREQGKIDEAVKSFREALAGDLPGSLRVSVYYELAQTYLKGGKYVEVRETIDELRSKNIPELKKTFIGQHLLPFLEAKLYLAEGQTDPEKKLRGLDLMEQLWQRGEFWHILVSAEVQKHMKKEDVSALAPFELWVLADETYLAENYAQASEYFEQYIGKTKATEPRHRQAMFNLAACYYRLGGQEGTESRRREELFRKAANQFLKVASSFPESRYAANAAEAYVKVASTIYEDNPTGENLSYYAEALKWALTEGPAAARGGDMRWLYANLLEKQEDYFEAAKQYELVDQNSEFFYEAKFRAVDCYRLDLYEKRWMNTSMDRLKRLAETTVEKMARYAEWAADTVARSQGEVAQELRHNGALALVMAAEILSQEKIEQYERALRLSRQYEETFPNQDELRGKALKVKIDCLYRQGRLAEAERVLDDLMETEEDVGPILRRLFVAITEEVDRLNRQGRKAEARQRVKLADNIGNKFTLYLAKKGDAEDVPVIEYELARLHMRAEDLDGEKGAIKRFLALVTFDPYENQEAFESGKKPVDPEYLAGLARSTKMLGDKLLGDDPKRAHQLLKRAAYYWENVAAAYSKPAGDLTEEQRREKYWEAKYNQMTAYADLHPLEQRFAEKGKATDYADVVTTFIASQRATDSDFGGPAMKVKFDRLYQRLGP